MASFDDLSEYSYSKMGAAPTTLNIGWLEPPMRVIGTTSLEFRNRLFMFCLVPINATRGYYPCEFCTNPADNGVRETIEGHEAVLGSAEIRVIGEGRIYAAPNLIYHYVTAHNYLPPAEFIEAVLKSPLPGSREFNIHFDREWVRMNLPEILWRPK